MAVRPVKGKVRKKVAGKKAARKKVARRPKARQVVSGNRTLSLPTKPKEIDRDLHAYKILIYGREKIGKTTIFASFPDAIFFSTEPGTKGLEVYEFNHDDGGVKTWEIFVQGVDLLLKTDRFRFVIIDTADRAYEKCKDWLCRTWGIDYPGVTAEGKEDYGKSWGAIRDEFQKQIDRIIASGRGVGFTSHSKEVEIKVKNAESYHRIQPTMSNQARKAIEPLVDFFFYAEYAKDNEGNTQRILICEGDESIWAGARAGVTRDFPRLLPMHPDNGYKIIEDAFLGKSRGLDARTLQPSKLSSKSGGKLINKQKSRAIRKSLKKKGVR